MLHLWNYPGSILTENEQEVLLKEEQIDLFEKWMALTVDEKKVIEELIYILSKK